MSRSRKSGGGGAGMDKVVWFLFVGGLIFAFFQIPYDPGAKGIIEIMQSKAEQVQSWVGGIEDTVTDPISDVIKGGGDPVQPNATDGTPYPEPGTPGTGGDPAAPAQGASISGITVAEASGAKYDRDEWNHWITVRSCWDVRDEVLSRQAVPGSLLFLDKSKKETSDINQACSIKSGSWVDPYTGETLTNPKDLDIDHMIPLNYTAQHGGQAWDTAKKEAYANDLNGASLLAVDKGQNRSKSDKGPGSWLPENEAYHCSYANNWVNVATTWQISMSQKDVEKISQILQNC